MSIHILDPHTIDRIAAGEVIERPSSIVKELVENAIDANATRIRIECRGGGVRLIRISDNGEGISPDEMRLAFERHATSKIDDASDLMSLHTLGFRGEALSSIAAVSRTECISKTASSLSGIRYQIEGGVEKSYEEVGAPDGTSFMIRDLFYNTPARAKFLKSTMTENAKITACVEQIALSHPEIAFRYLIDGREQLLTSGRGDVADVIFAIYGREVTDALLPLTPVRYEGVSVRGYLAKPQFNRGNRNYENYFVNGRLVKNRVIELAIEDGYGTRLMQHRYPFTCLFIDLPGDLFDVNVHPSKEEVRFLNEKSIHTAIRQAVEETLSKTEMILRSDLSDPAEGKAPQKNEESGISERTQSAAPFEVTAWEEIKSMQVAEASAAYADSKMMNSTQTSLFDRLPKNESASLRRIIGVAFHTYWIVEFEESLFLIDQHAAHEKILYERFMSAYQNAEVSSQALLPPLVISVNSGEQALLNEYQEAFSACGFQIEDFGGKEVRISAVPYHLSRFSPRDFFLTMLQALTEHRTKKEDLTIYVDRIAQEACKAAVKGGDALSFAEAKQLIDELFTLQDPYHCPHGRPTIISFTERDLEKRFKRIL